MKILNLSKINRKHIPLLATITVFVVVYLIGSIAYPGFLSIRVFSNLFIDNSFVGIIAIGMTFVILSGGIDLSVGSVVAFICIFSAKMIEVYHIHPMWVMLMSLGMGAALGLVMGCLIHFFELPAFLVTLVGMFLARGLSFMVSLQSIPIYHDFFSNLNNIGIPLGGIVKLTFSGIVFIVVFLIGVYLSHFTKFGRNTYAIGGNEQSSILMGLPVGKTKILIYTLSGTLSALGGIIYSLYTLSGYPLATVGLELDVIAAVVIGGTLLTGGLGFVEGTLVGVLILGLIQTFISFQGTLSSWWTKIVIGLLLFFFILIQRFLSGATKES